MSAAPTLSRRRPLYGADAVARYRLFCGHRCTDVNLHRWLGEYYRISTSETETGTDSEAE